MKKLLFVFLFLVSLSANSNLYLLKKEQFPYQSMVYDLYRLSHDDFGGRAPDSNYSLKTREFLKRRLVEIGIKPFGDLNSNGSRNYEAEFKLPPGGEFKQGTNLIGVFYPKGTENQSPRFLLSAHYDHLPLGHCGIRTQGESYFCNGAMDNAAGTAVVLAIAEMLKTSVKTPFVVAFWDLEEAGLIGSREYFKSTPQFDWSALNLFLNIDVAGAHIFRGMEKLHFVLGHETGGDRLFNHLVMAVQYLDLDIAPLNYAFGSNRSDHTSFVKSSANRPHIFFTDGTAPQFHTNADEFKYIDLEKLRNIGLLMGRVAFFSSIDSQMYSYFPPRFSNSVPMANFSDVHYLISVFNKLDKVADLNLLSDHEKTQLKSGLDELKKIRAQGPDNFGEQQVRFLLQFAWFLQSTSHNRPFIP